MQESYDNFMASSEAQGIKCSFERYKLLCFDQQEGQHTIGSVREAQMGLIPENRGIFKNIKRLDPIVPTRDGQVNTDFLTEGPDGITHGELKFPINFQRLAEEKGIKTGHFPSYLEIDYNIGKDIARQQKNGIGLTGGPKSIENVRHVVSLKDIPTEELAMFESTV